MVCLHDNRLSIYVFELSPPSLPFPVSVSPILSCFCPHAVSVSACIYASCMHLSQPRKERNGEDECAKNKEFIPIGASIEIESVKVEGDERP